MLSRTTICICLPSQVLAIFAAALGAADATIPPPGQALLPMYDMRDLLAPLKDDQGPVKGPSANPHPGRDSRPDPAPGVAALLPALAVCDLLPASAPLPAILLCALAAAVSRELDAGRQAEPADRQSVAEPDAGGRPSVAGLLAPAPCAAKQVEGGAEAAAERRRGVQPPRSAAGGAAGVAALAEACLGGSGGCEPNLAPCAAWSARLAAAVLTLLLRAAEAAAPMQKPSEPSETLILDLSGTLPAEDRRRALGALLHEAVEARVCRLPAQLARAIALPYCGGADNAAAILAAVRPLQVPLAALTHPTHLEHANSWA